MMGTIASRAGVFVAVWCLAVASVSAETRLERIRRLGKVTCGVAPGVAGFAEVDAQGSYKGLEVDLCRALSAALFGRPDKVDFVVASTADVFLKSDAIDVVVRRLTWSLRREGDSGLRFGPIMFYDGQGFMVAKRTGATRLQQLSGSPICVARGSLSEGGLQSYFAARKLALVEVPVTSADEVPAALDARRCGAYSGDVSELGSILSRMSNRNQFEILPDQISKEPLAPLLRRSDDALFDVVRWTVFAMIEAEERGVTSANVDAMRESRDPDIRRLLGVIPGNGKALGLDERWAYYIVKAVGNYGEAFERNVGQGSPIKLPRGLNRLWTEGGLMYAPPLR
jgi:general L-amino acid transport system substrate-binding protein